MQTLSSCPLKKEHLLVQEWNIEQIPIFRSYKRKNISKRLLFVGSFLHLRGDFKTCLRSKLFSRDYCGATNTFSLTLEDHSLASFNGVSGLSSENVVFSAAQIEGLGDKISSLSKIDNDNDKEKDEDFGSEEPVWIERNGKIDVRRLGLCLELARTSDDVEEVLKSHGELPLKVLTSLIRGLGKEKKIDSVMALFEWLKKRSQETDTRIRLNLYIYNSFLGAIKHAVKHDHVDSIINHMSVQGFQPNVVTYNTLMAIYIQHGKEIEALELFEEISQKGGLCPTPASYSTALLAYQGLGDGIGAIKFFAQVRDKHQKGELGICKNEDWDKEIVKLENFTIRMSFQVMRHWWLVNCESENGRSDILRILTEMDKAGIQPCRADYERLVWACTSEEHYVVAKELYSRIRERESSEISLSVCNHVIWVLGKAKKWWAALEIYEDMLDRGPNPNNLSYELIVSHFNILLTAAKRRGIWRWGMQLLDKMEEKGLKPGSKEWNAVLVACSKASETYAAVGIFKRMVEKGEKPTIISYGALLSALEKGKLYNEALQVWEHMNKVGVPPNLYTYTIMASVYTAQGRFNIVESIIKEMVTTGIEPTVVTFNAIISGCARNEMGQEAYEWFHRMKKDYKLTPDNVTYEMLIEALCKNGKPRLIYELYINARNEGLSLSAKAYDLIINSSQIYGATFDRSSLGPRPPEQKKKFKPEKNFPKN